MGCSVPNQGSNLGPLHWELGVLATDHRGNTRGVILNRQEVSVKGDENVLILACGDGCTTLQIY